MKYIFHLENLHRDSTLLESNLVDSFALFCFKNLSSSKYMGQIPVIQFLEFYKLPLKSTPFNDRVAEG
jgi:hypothetical protein